MNIYTAGHSVDRGASDKEATISVTIRIDKGELDKWMGKIELADDYGDMAVMRETLRQAQYTLIEYIVRF